MPGLGFPVGEQEGRPVHVLRRGKGEHVEIVMPGLGFPVGEHEAEDAGTGGQEPGEHADAPHGGRRLCRVVRVALVPGPGVGVADLADDPAVRARACLPRAPRRLHGTRLERFPVTRRHAHVAGQPAFFVERGSRQGRPGAGHAGQEHGEGIRIRLQRDHPDEQFRAPPGQGTRIPQITGHDAMVRVVVRPQALIRARVDERFQGLGGEHGALPTAADGDEHQIPADPGGARLLRVMPHASPVGAQAAAMPFPFGGVLAPGGRHPQGAGHGEADGVRSWKAHARPLCGRQTIIPAMTRMRPAAATVRQASMNAIIQ